MATLSFRNGRVYLGASSGAAAVRVTEARGFSLTIDGKRDDDGAMGDTWETALSGRLSWSASFEQNFDTAQITAFAAASQTDGPVSFYGYPDAATTARFYSGSAWVSWGVGGDLDTTGKGTVTLKGDGALSQV